jgi:hypothetical protein
MSDTEYRAGRHVLGAGRTGDLLLHFVPGSVPGWALCGTWCPVHPKVPAEASGRFCRTCRELEENER